jgi:hypothetical protein
VWLNNSANAPIIVAGLSQLSNAASLGIDHIISGAELQVTAHAPMLSR